jgi:hypothetical protein
VSRLAQPATNQEGKIEKIENDKWKMENGKSEV